MARIRFVFPFRPTERQSAGEWFYSAEGRAMNRKLGVDDDKKRDVEPKSMAGAELADGEQKRRTVGVVPHFPKVRDSPESPVA